MGSFLDFLSDTACVRELLMEEKSMWNYIWPILLVIGSNTVYNICAKSTPAEANAFVSLSVTYLVGTLLSIGMFYLTSAERGYFAELRKLNWASVVLGASVVALEFGYIAIYRAGWKVSVGSQVANIGLAVILIVVGVVFYKELISLKQIWGILLCLGGLLLLNT